MGDKIHGPIKRHLSHFSPQRKCLFSLYRQVSRDKLLGEIDMQWAEIERISTENASLSQVGCFLKGISSFGVFALGFSQFVHYFTENASGGLPW